MAQKEDTYKEEEHTQTSAEEKAHETVTKQADDSDQEEEHSETREVSREEQLEKDLAEMKDKYTRLFAEFDNFRKRTAKERIQLMKNASADLIRDMLPVLDDLNRAKQANENADDVNSVKEGYDLIHQKFYRSLEAQGLTPMDSKGKPFDTEYHEAITNIPAPSDDLKGKVVDVVESGYFLNDMVLRYAKVVVGQ